MPGQWMEAWRRKDLVEVQQNLVVSHMDPVASEHPVLTVGCFQPLEEGGQRQEDVHGLQGEEDLHQRAEGEGPRRDQREVVVAFP